MNFSFSEDQQMFRAAVRGLLEREAGGSAERHWRLAVENGWLGLMQSEVCGGLSLGALDAVVLHEELGRFLAPGPFATNIALVPALARFGLLLPSAADRMSAVVEGGAIFGLAEMRDGRSALVEHPALITELISVSLAESTVQHESLGVTGLQLRKAFDPSHPVGAIELSVSDLRTVSLDTLTAALGAFRLAHCAELIGLAEAALKKTLIFVRERVQFDRAVGSFQGLKHKLADSFVLLENAKTATYYAAWAWDQNPNSASTAVDIARAYSAKMAIRVVGDCIQSHGGMGFTWENGLHLSLRRVRRLSTTLGTPSEARRAIASVLTSKQRTETARITKKSERVI